MTPNTTVALYKTPFDITNQYIISVKTLDEAFSLVDGNFEKKEFTNCYWMRDNSSFRANGNIDELRLYNYCIYENNGRKCFAFIIDYTYINDKMTLVSLGIDFWLNFAGMYGFYQSPMRRCHPLTDIKDNLSYEPEPINVNKWDCHSMSEGQQADGDRDNIVLVTQIDVPHDYTTQAGLLNGNSGFLDYIKYMRALSIETSTASDGFDWLQNYYHTTPCVFGNYVQPTTYFVTCYTIPTYFRDLPKQGRTEITNGEADDGYSNTQSMPLSWGSGGKTPIWLKTKHSPAFNQLKLTFVGNSLDIPWEYIDYDLIDSGSGFIYEIKVDSSMHGCARIRPKFINIHGTDYHDLFSIASPEWDRCQFVGLGNDQSKAINLAIAHVRKSYNAVKNNAKALLGINDAVTFDPVTLNSGNTLPGVPVDFGGSYADTSKSGTIGVNGGLLAKTLDKIASNVLANASAQGRENAIGQLIQNEGIVPSGSATGQAIAGYNRFADLVVHTHVHPSDSEIDKIDTYFGTYGYNYNGKIMPVNIYAFSMPYWAYYETENAVVTGHNVPQYYINLMISRLNSGVFVFKDVANYKQFGLALSNHA